MENSPPGIQTIPAGAGEDGGFLFSTVGRNVGGDAVASGADTGASVEGLSALIVARPATAATAIHSQTLLTWRREGAAGACLRRGFLIFRT